MKERWGHERDQNILMRGNTYGWSSTNRSVHVSRPIGIIRGARLGGETGGFRLSRDLVPPDEGQTT